MPVLKEKIARMKECFPAWAESIDSKVYEQADILAESFEGIGFNVYSFNNGIFFEKDTEDAHIEFDIDETKIKEEDGVFEVTLKFWRR